MQTLAKSPTRVVRKENDGIDQTISVDEGHSCGVGPQLENVGMYSSADTYQMAPLEDLIPPPLLEEYGWPAHVKMPKPLA